jgi:Bacterial conjugation TrbI-like protein
MIHPNGHDSSTATIPTPAPSEAIKTPTELSSTLQQPIDIATRARLRAKQQFQQNRFVMIGAGALVVALLIFVATSIPHRSPAQKTKVGTAAMKEEQTQTADTSVDRSLFPITDSGRPSAKESHEGFLNEKDLERSVTRRSHPTSIQPGPSNPPGTLGSIPPFGPDQPGWQAPPYQAGAAPVGIDADLGKAEREAMEKSSWVYVRTVAATQTESQSRDRMNLMTPEIGLGLSTGTRLRARLESAASTAVRAPVLAVIEYTYEGEGQIIVPAGAKAVGHIQEADRSGYVRVQFESLIMPDGATIPIQAVATDLDMRPLKGKVEGKNTGKNVLVRSLSGIGEAGSLLLGRGSLNQPLSESDLMRERVSNNIGEASDGEISRMAITSRIVVTVSADTPIYVVLEQAPRGDTGSGQSSTRTSQTLSTNAEELRQLLQLKRELNQSSPAPQ